MQACLHVYVRRDSDKTAKQGGEREIERTKTGRAGSFHLCILLVFIFSKNKNVCFRFSNRFYIRICISCAKLLEC